MSLKNWKVRVWSLRIIDEIAMYGLINYFTKKNGTKVIWYTLKKAGLQRCYKLKTNSPVYVWFWCVNLGERWPLLRCTPWHWPGDTASHKQCGSQQQKICGQKNSHVKSLHLILTGNPLLTIWSQLGTWVSRVQVTHAPECNRNISHIISSLGKQSIFRS